MLWDDDLADAGRDAIGVNRTSGVVVTGLDSVLVETALPLLEGKGLVALHDAIFGAIIVLVASRDLAAVLISFHVNPALPLLQQEAFVPFRDAVGGAIGVRVASGRCVTKLFAVDVDPTLSLDVDVPLGDTVEGSVGVLVASWNIVAMLLVIRVDPALTSLKSLEVTLGNACHSPVLERAAFRIVDARHAVLSGVALL
jgi:hypothetical protein